MQASYRLLAFYFQDMFILDRVATQPKQEDDCLLKPSESSSFQTRFPRCVSEPNTSYTGLVWCGQQKNSLRALQS